MDMANELARENCLKAHALVVELLAQLEITERRRRKAPRLDVMTEYLEAHTAELEFLALDLALEIEATEAADREIADRRHAAAVAREAERLANPVKFLLDELAAKAEREEARKAAMAAWQKLRAAQKEDYVHSDNRERLPAHFDRLPTIGYQSLAERYLAHTAAIMEDLEYWRRRHNAQQQYRRTA